MESVSLFLTLSFMNLSVNGQGLRDSVAIPKDSLLLTVWKGRAGRIRIIMALPFSTVKNSL